MKYALIFLSILFLQQTSFAQSNELKAYLDNKQFYAPGVGNYVEFQLQFVGYSLNYKGKEGGLQAELAIQMKITQGDSIIASDAYRLESPIMVDSIVDDFYDIKRFQLNPGTYKFSISLLDLNSEEKPLNASQSIIVEEFTDAISISDIQIAEYASIGDPESFFYKSGYEIIPRLSTFYPEQLNTIPVYLEIYNSKLLEKSLQRQANKQFLKSQGKKDAKSRK